jgi:hypothetical protein
MAAPHYFDFIGTVWGLMPDEDKDRMGELWQAYEQVIAAVYQQYAEVNLNIAIRDLQAYSSERWLPYTFGADNFINRPAVITSNQDISNGINMLSKHLLKFKIDGLTIYTVDCRGVDPLVTTIFEIVAKINFVVGFAFARAIFDNTIVQLVSPTSGVGSSIEILETTPPLENASEFILGVDSVSLPTIFPEFRYPYTLPYERVVSIPTFQDAIREESVLATLTEGADYSIDRSTGVISFAAEPVLTPKLWAKKSLTDKENPWNNFGFLMGVYTQNSPRYINVLQGLWFAFWNGPTPQNVRRALYLLFGLAVAQEDGVVTAVSSTEVSTLGDNGVSRTVEIPTGLLPEVVVGQRVLRFDPLISGIDVFDKINKPGFIATEIGRAGLDRFLTENATLGPGDTDETKALKTLEEHTFLPQIQVDAFVNRDIDLGNVQIFLNAIKPLINTYLFQVIVGEFQDPLPLDDDLAPSPDIDLTPNLDANETTFLEPATLLAYETALNGGLDLDPEGVTVRESVEIDVTSFAVLIDTFTV